MNALCPYTLTCAFYQAIMKKTKVFVQTRLPPWSVYVSKESACEPAQENVEVARFVLKTEKGIKKLFHKFHMDTPSVRTSSKRVVNSGRVDAQCLTR